MTGPNTRARKFWTESEDKLLVIGWNRYMESASIYRAIEEDESLNFNGRRSNVDLKDRIRFIYPNLRSYKGFLIPIICRDPKEYIPEEYWEQLDDDDDSEETLEVVPEEQREAFNYIVYKYSTDIRRFEEIYDSLPSEINLDVDDPVKNNRTWSQICDYSFKGRHILSPEKKVELLERLIINGYIKRISFKSHVLLIY